MSALNAASKKNWFQSELPALTVLNSLYVGGKAVSKYKYCMTKTKIHFFVINFVLLVGSSFVKPNLKH